MSHELRRLSKSLLEKPQLITQTRFEEIEAFLTSRNDGIFNQDVNLGSPFDKDDDDQDDHISPDLVKGNIGYLKVEGALSYKLTGLEALCGGASYTGLLKTMDTLCACEDVKVIVMQMNSGGGEAYRCFETARELRKKADTAGKKFVGYIDGLAASAGYGLVSACHNVIINPDAEAGSIGVVIRLQNSNEAMKKAGIKTKYITAGASKVPFDEEGEFRKDFIEDLQKRVYELYDNFVNHVVDMRGGKISSESVKNTEARVFSAEEARTLGLVDEIMEAETFEKYLKETYDLSSESGENKDNYKGDMVMSKTPQLSTEEVAALQAQLASMQELEAKLAVFEAKEVAAKTAEMKTLVEGAELSNVEGIVNLMMGSEDVKTLMSGVIEDIGKIKASHESAIASLETSHSDKIAELTASHTEALEAAKAEATEAKAKAEDAKTEFAASKAIEGDNTSLEDTAKETKKSSALANFIKENY